MCNDFSLCVAANVLFPRQYQKDISEKNICFALRLCGVDFFRPGRMERKRAKDGKRQSQLQELIKKINAKLSANPTKRTEQDFAEELKEFDTILEQHKSEKSDDVAQVLMMKAVLYSQVFQNAEKGEKLMEQLQKDFPVVASRWQFEMLAIPRHTCREVLDVFTKSVVFIPGTRKSYVFPI